MGKLDEAESQQLMGEVGCCHVQYASLYMFAWVCSNSSRCSKQVIVFN